MDIIAATIQYRTTTYPSYTSASLDAADLGGFFAGFAIMFVAMTVIGLLINMALTWGVYKKGGYKGWEGIVPFYNNYCLYKMADVSMALFIVSIFIPIVNIYMYFELAKKFGKEAIYGLGLFFLPIIFMPILGYGAAEFQGETAGKATAAPATEAPAPAQEAPAQPAASDTAAKEEPAKEESEKTAE